MDESWRMRMGMPSLAATRRRASEDLTLWTSADSGWSRGRSDSARIDAQDFNDVFGGPPTSVLSRKMSYDFTNNDHFYNEIFQRPELQETVKRNRSGRRLPEFRIPPSHGADVFGSSNRCSGEDDDQKEKKSASSSRLWRSMSMSKWTKSKSKSKSNSSSVLSFEETSLVPVQPGSREEDVALTSFAAKLRPINVPFRWNSSGAMGESNESQSSEMPFQCAHTSFPVDSHYPPNEFNDEHFMRSCNPGFSQQFPSPEANIPYSTIVGIPVDDVGELESPSSANSVLYHDLEASVANYHLSGLYEHNGEQEEDDDDGEDFSSYVIEFNSCQREVADEAVDINEAIAWAKEKFHGCSSSGGEMSIKEHEERSMVPLTMEVPDNIQERYSMMPLYMETSLQHSAMREEESLGGHSEMPVLDERVNSWSAGRETYIQLLLSTLHNILWSNSGWDAIPLCNLTEPSQVKKAYQKARLCIHPDKLQQRGATPRQKYVANKAFSFLQNAWELFISREIFFS